MNYEVFEKKIKPLMDLVETLCEEENIEFSSKFKFDDKSTYHYSSGFPFDATDIITMIQHWEAKNNKKLFPANEENKKNGNTFNITINTQNTENKFAQEN